MESTIDMNIGKLDCHNGEETGQWEAISLQENLLHSTYGTTSHLANLADIETSLVRENL